MCMTRFFTSPVLSFFVLLSLSFHAHAVDSQAVDSQEQASNMFIFQQKLANKGNAEAQYNIAFMYETGDGIKQSLVKAKEWYVQAAEKNNQSAANRLSYLQIMESGFNQEKHSAWLDSVKHGASVNKSESLFLMAQIYQNGLGVKKDLDKALELMYRLGSEGNVVADQQVLVIEKEQLVLNKQRKEKQRKRAEKIAAKKREEALALKKQQEATAWEKDVVASVVVASTVPAGVVSSSDVSTSTVPAKTSLKESDALADEKARKRAKYEAVMRQLAEEQAELDRLQESVGGDELASAEDEL